MLGWFVERELKKITKKRLLSFYEITNKLFGADESFVFLTKDKGIMPENNKVELFLDSGAFSAWTQKKEINLKDYIQFIKENENVITVYANLDVIGDDEATWKNQRIMEKAGLHPLPVYHFNDDIKHLHYCIANYEYFCLGGMARHTTNLRTMFLDKCFQFICNTKDNIPNNKIHGFGMTSLTLMLRYPWYSIDSTSWVVTGRNGSIYIPRWVDNKWIYNDNPWKIGISNRSPSQKLEDQHFTTYPKQNQTLFLTYIHEKGYQLGRSEFKKVSQSHELAENERWAEKKPTDKSAKRELEIIVEPGISNKYQLRDEMNIIYFLDLERSLPKWPWAFTKQKGGFGI
jgi:hypothetical protein